MNDAEILTLIQKALFEVAPKRKNDFANLDLGMKIDDLALDSITTMEMIGYIEDQLDLVFDEASLANVSHLSDLAGLVRGAQVEG